MGRLGLAEGPTLAGAISVETGFGWLVAALLLLVGAGLLALRRGGWWMAALPGVVLSQVMISSQWSDARVGTIANLVILLATVVGYGQWSFERSAGRDIDSLVAGAGHSSGGIISAADLALLPPVVQRWLRRAEVVGKAAPVVVRLAQRGTMKTKPGGNWASFTASQTFTLERPGFVWRAAIRMAPFLHVGGIDRYQNGRGRMRVKLLSLVPLADTMGPEVDRGTLVRFLAEMCWFPAAALRPYVRWEALDPTSARATLTYGGIAESGVFRFTPEGDVAGFEARRYYDRPQGATLEDWVIAMTRWGTLAGVRVPVESEVTWRLVDGEFTWLRLEVTQMSWS